MDWQTEVNELKSREQLSEQMGGPEKVARQHEFGKLTIRERVELIADKKSFHEVGKLAGVGKYDENGKLVSFTPSNFVFGTAEIDHRPVIISGDDFTIRGGSTEASIKEKRLMSEGLAIELRLPHIRLVDGMGGGGSVKIIETAGRTYIPAISGWDMVVNHLGIAPSVSLALGSVAGLGAARVCTSHYSIVVKDTALMMIAGPSVVNWANLGNVSKEELGASKIHTHNGTIDDLANSEQEAFAMARRFLSYLPSNVYELPPVMVTSDDPDRKDDSLLSIVPRDARKVYKMRTVINTVVDTGSFFEIGRRWGSSIITGLARFDGIPVALFAENPEFFAGAWTADSSRKLIRLMDLASTFHLPMVHFVDCPGFYIGKQAEEQSTIRYGSQALAGLVQAKVPFCSVVIRKAFGVAAGANRKPGSRHFRYAWPSGDWGSLPIEGGIEVAYKAELSAADDRDSHLAKIKERLNSLRSPFRSAEYFEIEDIIDPRETRPILCRWTKLARKALRPGVIGFTYRP